ncbi:hypothetical protein ACQ0MK_18760 [Thalassospira lucentensis]|uniref:hypothetical protein n=1 Tax=Thalassospira lucentensis TaxID=168935 RepID=UPI003D2EBD13
MSNMQLVAVTQKNIAPYVAFRMEVADEEGRRYYQTIDLAAAILTQGSDYALEDEHGKLQAAVTIRRKEARDGNLLVMISVEGKDKKPETNARLLREVLATETGNVVTLDTRYNVYNPPEMTLPNAKMAEMGFTEIPGTYRYKREPGPPRSGEFPHADRAVERGYKTLVIDDAYVASDPDIFEKLADIFNRAFSNRDNVTPSTPERMRKSYETDANDIIIAKLGDDVTGSITLSYLGDSVLSPQYNCMRRHWGTGSVDLMCRHLAQLVADRWNVPIIGYAEARNAASWKALERFGLTRVEELMIWERHVPTGETFTL